MKIIAATALLALAATSAQAATFGTYDNDGNHFCALNLHGPDEMRISVEKGSSVTGAVWLEFLDQRDKSFAEDMELRLEITTDKNEPADAFLGGMGESEPVPLFLLPLSTVGDMAAFESFSYQLEDRPAVTIKGLTVDEVQKLVDCMDEE